MISKLKSTSTVSDNNIGSDDSHVDVNENLHVNNTKMDHISDSNLLIDFSNMKLFNSQNIQYITSINITIEDDNQCEDDNQDDTIETSTTTTTKISNTETTTETINTITNEHSINTQDEMELHITLNQYRKGFIYTKGKDSIEDSLIKSISRDSISILYKELSKSNYNQVFDNSGCCSTGTSTSDDDDISILSIKTIRSKLFTNDKLSKSDFKKLLGISYDKLMVIENYFKSNKKDKCYISIDIDCYEDEDLNKEIIFSFSCNLCYYQDYENPKITPYIEDSHIIYRMCTDEKYKINNDKKNLRLLNIE